MRRTADMRWPRWSVSAISKVNRRVASRSREVEELAERMLTWLSESTRVTSESRPVRSRASTCICTRKTPEPSLFQETEMIRSGSFSNCSTLPQSCRWTEMPEPRVMKPMIGSPGTGVQHRATLTHTSEEFMPSTTIPGSVARGTDEGEPVARRSRTLGLGGEHLDGVPVLELGVERDEFPVDPCPHRPVAHLCLLYTSDAADD